MSAAFTPGPYSVHPYSEVQKPKVVTGADGRYFVSAGISIGAGRKLLGHVSMRTNGVGYPSIETESEMQAVANLWMAAPELLEALQALVNSFETHRPKALWDNARAAIAKATGGAA